MNWVSMIIIFMVMVFFGIIFASIAVDYLPKSVKDWLYKKIFGGKKKNE